jgi:hypothetical protein
LDTDKKEESKEKSGQDGD